MEQHRDDYTKHEQYLRALDVETQRQREPDFDMPADHEEVNRGVTPRMFQQFASAFIGRFPNES